MIPRLSYISSLVKENYMNLMLVAGSIATLSIAAPLIYKGIPHFYVWKSGCEQIVAINNLLRERNSGNPAFRDIKFEYPEGVEIKILLPHEVAKEFPESPLCFLIASARNVKRHEEEFTRHGADIDNPYN